MFRVLVHIDLYMLLFLASWSVVVIRSAYRLLVDRRLIPDFIMTSHSSIDEAEDQVSYCIISTLSLPFDYCHIIISLVVGWTALNHSH